MLATCPQHVVRVVLVNFGERLHMQVRAAVYVVCRLVLYRRLHTQFYTDTGLPTPLFMQLKET